MVCEEQGFFLEIADVVRSFGLTILKGEMEARDRKLWAHFIVEVDSVLIIVQANRQVTSFHLIHCMLNDRTGKPTSN